MKMNNKGEVFFTLATVPGIFHSLGLAVFLAAAWHVPAWQEAKKNGTTAEYQAQKMWPQQWFAKLPGGDDYKGGRAKDVSIQAPEELYEVTGNGGNFPGGNSNP